MEQRAARIRWMALVGLLVLLRAVGCGAPPDEDEEGGPELPDSATGADAIEPGATFMPLGSDLLDEAILAYARGQGALDANLRVLTETVELNGDADVDAVALLMSMDWCGSGGCSLVVFRGSRGSFQPVSRTLLVDPPVWVSEQRTDGWRDIVVQAPGDERVALEHGRAGYPLDPSRAPELEGGAEPPGELVFSPDEEPRLLPIH